MCDRYFNGILDEIRDCFLKIDPLQVQEMLDGVREAKRVVLHGKGRMGMALKAFGCTLLQAGKDVRVVADVTSPHIGQGDLFIGASASGFPLASTRFYQLARREGARVCAITAYRKGPIGTLADFFLEIRARTMNLDVVDVPSMQPMCSTLEQVTLLALDLVTSLYQSGESCTLQKMTQYMDAVLKPMRAFDVQRVEAFIDTVQMGKGQYFLAWKRQMHVLSMFAMRVYHMGFNAYVIQEVNCPPMQPGDTLIMSAFTGDDPIADFCVKLAAQRGLDTVVITASKAMRNVLLEKTLLLDFADDQQDEITYTQRMLIVLDYAVLCMMRRYGWKESDLSSRHTNLE